MAPSMSLTDLWCALSLTLNNSKYSKASDVNTQKSFHPCRVVSPNASWQLALCCCYDTAVATFPFILAPYEFKPKLEMPSTKIHSTSVKICTKPELAGIETRSTWFQNVHLKIINKKLATLRTEKFKPGNKYHSAVNSTKLPKAAMWYSVLWSRRYELRVRFRGLVTAVAKNSDQWKNMRTATYQPNNR